MGQARASGMCRAISGLASHQSLLLGRPQLATIYSGRSLSLAPAPCSIAPPQAGHMPGALACPRRRALARAAQRIARVGQPAPEWGSLSLAFAWSGPAAMGYAPPWHGARAVRVSDVLCYAPCGGLARLVVLGSRRLRVVFASPSGWPLAGSLQRRVFLSVILRPGLAPCVGDASGARRWAVLGSSLGQGA